TAWSSSSLRLALELGNLVLPLTRAGGGLWRYPSSPLAEHAEDDATVRTDDNLHRAGIQTAVTGDLQRADAVIALEGIAASLGHYPVPNGVRCLPHAGKFAFRRHFRTFRAAARCS